MAAAKKKPPKDDPETENAILRFALRAMLLTIKNEKRLPCFCGTEPYTDGDTCPVCTALALFESFKPLWDRKGYKPKKNLCGKSAKK